eukprot:EG_transcript_8237
MCDPDDLLAKSSKDVIEGYTNGLQPHAQVAVLVVHQMRPAGGSADPAAAAEEFARAVHDRWGVGEVGRQNGVLVFLAVADRRTFISVGEGVRGILNDWQLDRIIEGMKPDLQARQYGTVLERCVVDLGLLLGGDAFRKQFGLQASVPAPPSSWPGLLFATTIFGTVFGCMFWQNRQESRERRGRQALASLVQEVSTSQQENRYQASSCPICLDDFPPSASWPTSPQRPMALPCGHVFCRQCLTGLFQSPTGSQCPICRKPIDPNDHAAHHSDAGHFTRTSAMFSDYAEWSRFRMMETRYRLHRMNALYPNVMTAPTVDTLNGYLDTNSLGQFQEAAAARLAEVDRVITDRKARAQAERSGSGGSHSSCGGGSSSGGRGGGW